MHLSHTNTEVDARVLRAMRAVAGQPEFKAEAFGIRSSPSKPNAQFEEGNHHLLDFSLPGYWSRARRAIPRLGRWLASGILRHLAFSAINFPFAILVFGVLQGKKVSIVHCHDVTVLPTAAFLSLWKGAKLVYDAHELESERTGLSGPEGKLVRRVESFFWAKVDYLISVSPGILTWYADRFPPKPAECILNSPALGKQEQFGGPEFSLRKILGLRKAHLIFVYLGLFSKGRGIEKILSAFSSSYQDFNHVVFVGHGPLSTLIVQTARESGNVHVLDPVPHSDVVGFISSADFGLVIIEPISLSYKLALPNKLFEFAFAGLPVIASDNPEIRSVVTGYSLGVLVPPTKEGIIEGLDLVKNCPRVDRDGLRALGQEEQSRKLRKVYSTLLGKTDLKFS